MTAITLLSLGASLIAVLIAIGAAAQIARSTPTTLTKGFADLAGRVVAAETIVEGLQGKWRAKSEELEALIEELESTFQRVERKRASAAAAAHRAGIRDNEAAGPLTDRAAIQRRAREMGILT